MKTDFTLFFGPFPVKNDNFRSRGVTSGISQCQLRLRSEHRVYAHTGSIDLRDLNVDQTLVKLLKNNKKGGFDPISGHSGTYDWTTRSHCIDLRWYFNFDVLVVARTRTA